MNGLQHRRPVLVAVGTIGLLLAVGIFFSLPGARELWVWPSAPPLSLAFVGSWFAGGTAALIWVGLSGHYGTSQALMLAMSVGTAGSAVQLFGHHELPGNERYLPFAIMFTVVAVAGIVAFFGASRILRQRYEFAPTPVRWAFLVFSAILLTVGVSMVFDLQAVFPIPLRRDTNVIYGWFFLGSFVYYFYGFLKPTIDNMIGQMISFLVYDLLLIPPFIRYLPNVNPDLRSNLVVYLAVLVVSSIFCAYFLFMHPETRVTRHVGRGRHEHGVR